MACMICTVKHRDAGIQLFVTGACSQNLTKQINKTYFHNELNRNNWLLRIAKNVLNCFLTFILIMIKLFTRYISMQGWYKIFIIRQCTVLNFDVKAI